MEGAEQVSDPIFDPITQSALATMIRESVWAYPLLETLHVLGLALLFGPILLFDLRVLGWNRDLSAARLHKALLPWVWTGFTVNLISGALLFISDAAEFAANTALRVKLVLIVIAGLNALYFQTRFASRSDDWQSHAPGGARASALISILLWVSIIAAGRMIAYIK